MRLDETERPLRVGEGRISGYLSIALGMLSLLAVLCFMFPDYLTTPSLRAGYDLSLMRKLLAAGMVFSAGFGLLTFLLNRQKRLGALGIVLTLIAAYLGGSSVQVGPRYDTVRLYRFGLVHSGLAGLGSDLHRAWRRSCRIGANSPSCGRVSGMTAAISFLTIS